MTVLFSSTRHQCQSGGYDSDSRQNFACSLACCSLTKHCHPPLFPPICRVIVAELGCTYHINLNFSVTIMVRLSVQSRSECCLLSVADLLQQFISRYCMRESP